MERPRFFSAGAIKGQLPGAPLDNKAGVAYGAFINTAYRMFENPIGDKLKPGQPPDFPEGYRMTAWINMSDFAIFGEKIRKFYGFIATEIDDPHSHILAIRGTEHAIEWWDDAVLIPFRFEPVPSAGLVHGGFYRIYRTMEVIRVPRPIVPGTIHPTAATTPHPMSPDQTFADQIEELLTTLPTEEGLRETEEGAEHKHHFIVTGHSLGAALCTLYIMEHAIKKKAQQSRKVTIERLCTFASPRIGMQVFVTQFDGLPIDSWRIANKQDIVPMIPPSWPIPFRHVDAGYEFSSNGVVRFNPKCWHSMLTYMHWLDAAIAIEQGCRL